MGYLENETKKIQLEKVEIPKGKSFKVFSPRLRNHFYWHYHPEFELVYVKADSGLRHVGSHMSGFNDNDLVFIGSNVPHLNFDYRVRSDYQQVVVQLKEDFFQSSVCQLPELANLFLPFQQPGLGLSYSGETKAKVAKKLLELPLLDDFDQLILLLEILRILAETEEANQLSDEGLGINSFLKDKIRMGAIYEYIDAHYHQQPDVNIIAEKVHLTTAAFCRYFKKQTSMTFTDFVNEYRMDIAKNHLKQGKNVTETCFAVGFQSLSYFSRLFKKVTGATPSSYKKTHNL